MEATRVHPDVVFLQPKFLLSCTRLEEVFLTLISSFSVTHPNPTPDHSFSLVIFYEEPFSILIVNFFSSFFRGSVEFLAAPYFSLIDPVPGSRCFPVGLSGCTPPF